jgi:hypothetical protein
MILHFSIYQFHKVATPPTPFLVSVPLNVSPPGLLLSERVTGFVTFGMRFPPASRISSAVAVFW